MANTVQLRRSAIPGKVPTLGELMVGELAINLVDHDLFYSDGSAVVQLNHSANIDTDSGHRFVTDAQIASWSTPYELPTASATVLGGVKIGNHIDMVGGVISVAEADTDTAGVLTAADWNTFNGKQDALGYTPVDKAGDTMSGPLALSGAPTLAAHATNKNYVDNGLSAKLNKAGDTMSGPLILSGDPVVALGAATMQYVDNQVSIVSGRYATGVDTVVELASFATASLVDKQLRLVEGVGAIFRFDATATDSADGVNVIIPSDTPPSGRWFKVQSATQSHEQLTGLLGGGANDHLHLTTAEKNAYDAHIGDYGLHLTTDQNTFLDAITVDASKVNFLSGVTSDIQTQLNSKQASLGYTPVNKAGDTMTGLLVLSAAPSAAMNPVNLGFLESYVVDGGTF